jgi:hypothetical protein
VSLQIAVNLQSEFGSGAIVQVIDRCASGTICITPWLLRGADRPWVEVIPRLVVAVQRPNEVSCLVRTADQRRPVTAVEFPDVNQFLIPTLRALSAEIADVLSAGCSVDIAMDVSAEDETPVTKPPPEI